MDMIRTKAKTKTQSSALAALAGATLLGSFGISGTSVALPALARDFAAPVSAVQWVVLAYLVTVTVVVVAAGRAGDLFGHRRVLAAGLVLFALASVVCAAAPTLAMLIAARAIQGIGGAVLMALPVSLARATVASERTGAAMGLLGTASAVGTALGPSLGGLLIAALGWRAPFAAMAVLGLLLIAAARPALPPSAPPVRGPGSRLDWPGIALLAVALTLYALATTGAAPTAISMPGLLLPAAAIALLLFLVVEARSAAPLLPVSVLRDRATGSALAMNVLVAAVMMSTLVVGPFFLSLGLGMDDALVGLVMAVGPVTAALSGVLAGRATDRFGPRRVLAAGLVQIVIGLVGLALLPLALGVFGYVAALVVLTPGFQMFLAANSTAVMAAAATEQRGVLSGLLGLSRNLGFMTGASVIATLFAAAAEPGLAVDNAPEVIVEAFTTTFLLAAGLAVLALVMALLDTWAARR